MILFLSLLGSAFGQAAPGSGFDAHGFRLAGHDADARDPLVVTRPGAFEAHSWFAGGLLEYASSPLVFEQTTGRVTELDDVVAANVSVGYAPMERLRLDIGAPIFFFAQGEEEALGAGIGDIRASGQLQLVRPVDGGLGTAIIGNLDLPSGRPEAWLGQTTVSGGVGVALTYEAERLTLSGMMTTQLRPNTRTEERPQPTKGGDAFTWGGSAGYLIGDRSGLTVEVHGEVATDPEVRTAIGTPVEALLSIRHLRESGGFLTVGVGTGLTRGAGASPLRLLLGGGFGDPGQPKVGDMDGDGLDDLTDACPATPENVNGYLDNDGCEDQFPTATFVVEGPSGDRDSSASIKAGSVEGNGSVSVTADVATIDSKTSVQVSSGSCLAAEGDFAFGKDDAEHVLVLEPVRNGTLDIRVEDTDGEPIDEAIVRFRSGEPGCSPEKFDGLEAGEATLNLGPGMHFAFVTAEGYSVHQESFTLDDGGNAKMTAVLSPALAKLQTDEAGQTTIAILEKVFFDTGKSTIQERSFPLLSQVAAIVSANDLQHLEVGGHTDSQGAEASNLALSQRRADAVRTYLIEQGIEAERLVATGFGESVPVADNGTRAGRAANRRVEFSVPAAVDAPAVPENGQR